MEIGAQKASSVVLESGSDKNWITADAGMISVSLRLSDGFAQIEGGRHTGYMYLPLWEGDLVGLRHCLNELHSNGYIGKRDG